MMVSAFEFLFSICISSLFLYFLFLSLQVDYLFIESKVSVFVFFCVSDWWFFSFFTRDMIP